MLPQPPNPSRVLANARECDVPLGEIRRQRQRPLRSLASVPVSLHVRRRTYVSRLDRLGMRQRGPRQRILRVEVHCLPEMRDACRHACLRPARYH